MRFQEVIINRDKLSAEELRAIQIQKGREVVLAELKKYNFKEAKLQRYSLWQLPDSKETIYIRTYKEKMEVCFYADFDPHCYLKLRYDEVLRRLKHCDNNLIMVLLKNDIKC